MPSPKIPTNHDIWMLWWADETGTFRVVSLSVDVRTHRRVATELGLAYDTWHAAHKRMRQLNAWLDNTDRPITEPVPAGNHAVRLSGALDAIATGSMREASHA